MARSQRDDLVRDWISRTRRTRRAAHQPRASNERRKGRLDFALAAGIENIEVLPDRCARPARLFAPPRYRDCSDSPARQSPSPWHELAQQLQSLRAQHARRKSTPVMLPPGRLRLATRPSLTGSPPLAKTIGIVVVAALAASADGVVRRRSRPPAGGSRSATSAGNRSGRSSAQRNSIATFRPSTKPASFRPWRNAVMSAASASDALRRNPTTGIAGCCARAANGHATVPPPSSAMNSRRLIRSPRRLWRAASPARSRPSAFAVL